MIEYCTINPINGGPETNDIVLKFYAVYIVCLREEKAAMRIHESAENYLETILILSKSLPVVRSVDIANELGFKKPSVSVAMKNLRENGLITVTDAGFIYLTESGLEIAAKIYERHEFLSAWLQRLGVDKKTATEDACKMEHTMSAASFSAIKKYVNDHSF